MKILILEDDQSKLDNIINVAKEFDGPIDIVSTSTFHSFHKQVERDQFNLIIVDLLVPQFDTSIEAVDLTDQIIDATRDHCSINFRTPVIAITSFDEKAEENFSGLNNKDITVITYSPHSDGWRTVLKNKIECCIPQITFPFVIVCALTKEVRGFEEAGYKLGITRAIYGLECNEIDIGGIVGVVVTSPRMGLVDSAITCTLAAELFRPKLLCMSGICAGIEKKAGIYDVIIPDVCHQHDFGRWGKDGFEHEPYSVQIEPSFRLNIIEIINSADFNSSVSKGVTLNKSEFPEDKERLEFAIKLAPASSGSAVIADEIMVALIKEQHRKMTAFEMESFSVYESARLARCKPNYFSAKCVVDDGGKNKGDHYHRVACILSAKVVYELIRRGVAKF